MLNRASRRRHEPCETFARSAGAQILDVPRGVDFETDVAAVRAALSRAPKVMALCALLSAALLTLAPTPASAQPTPATPALDRNDIQVLLQTLHGAVDQGFERGEFDIGVPESQLAAPDPAIRAAAEAALKATVIRYARAQHGLRLSAFPRNWAIRPEPYDAAADFAAALAQRRLAAWSASLPPSDPRYVALVAAYGQYRAIADQGGWPMLANGPPLKPGMTGERVSALRRRVAVEDPAVRLSHALATTQQDTYDQPLADAVSRAQARYGLTADGTVGPATLKALNVPVAARLEQIRANLERWRWAPRALPPYRVELNIADASLGLHEPGKPDLEMRVIVGRPSKPTPMFADQIRAVVFNPPWNVPASIAAKEIWPRIRRDPGYMAREHFVVRPGGGLQQLPGPDCALGLIKFDLSNSFGVYLHDTPSRNLFASDSRTLSHGCMRIEKPNLLAKRILRDDSDWPETKIDLTLMGGKTVRTPLRRPVPIYVFYWSVFVEGDGQVEFRPDVYGWDRKLRAAL